MWKKFAKTKLSKISASAKDGDVILIEFDHNNISLAELQCWYNTTSEKLCCPVRIQKRQQGRHDFSY